MRAADQHTLVPLPAALAPMLEIRPCHRAAALSALSLPALSLHLPATTTLTLEEWGPDTFAINLVTYTCKHTMTIPKLLKRNSLSVSIVRACAPSTLLLLPPAAPVRPDRGPGAG